MRRSPGSAAGPGPTRPILNFVFKENRFRKIKINTFGFHHLVYSNGQVHSGLQAANGFLKELAKSTGGDFTPMKVNPKFTPDNPYGE